MSIQQLLLGVGASKKTYLDDVFSTDVYEGSMSGKVVNNGINLATEGGLVWFKRRDGAHEHGLYDTARGVEKALRPDQNVVADNSASWGLTDFNTDGYGVFRGGDVGAANQTYAAWTFRKAKGFFDVVTYTGNGSNRTIAHSLGCIPGCIMIKNLDTAENWRVYHKSIGAEKHVILNLTNAEADSATQFNDTEPTASVFSVGTDDAVNKNGDDFVAYVFAGGESPAATAKCVEMDGTGDYFTTSTSSDYTFGTGDFTVETWLRIDEDYVGNNNYPTVLDARTDGSYTNFWVVYVNPGDQKIYYYTGGANRITSKVKMERGQWYHIAVVRNSETVQFYINGISQGTYSDSTNYSHTSIVWGSNAVSLGSYVFDGALSNLRVVKGTAVYTSAFKPPTAPLTNITNTKLLCFNDSSTTGTTVGTITASGDPTASTDSPFDDPAAFTFGENGDQGIIKCGSYVGNGSATGPEINLGWEPSWLLIKNAEKSENWLMFDSMRGIVTGGNEARLFANATTAESSTGNFINLTPTGFQINDNGGDLNEPDDKIIYLAIRRPDGYCGKPAEAGTDVFAMDVGSNSSTIPEYDSGFPVDLGLYRNPSSTNNFHLGARLIQERVLKTNSNDASSGVADTVFDSNVGWGRSYAGTYGSSYQSWMWKRHAGFDVVTYKGNGSTDRDIYHNLNKIPEMVFIKRRDYAYNWGVYHKGANGGTNPHNYLLVLNADSAESSDPDYMLKETPTSISFKVANSQYTNVNNGDYIAMLFASVDGISKVGYFNGSSSNVTVTTGFSPRFIIIKRTDNSGSWRVFDTVRGLNSDSAADAIMSLNTNDASSTGTDYIATSSTGFTVNTANSDINANGGQHIYYAHA